MKHVTGTITYVDLEGGFWGIKTNTNNYLPLEMPDQLKYDGLETSCALFILEDVMTMNNWGIPCKLISFKTKW